MPEWKREGIVHACPEVNVSFLNRRPEFAAWQLDQLQRLGIPVHFGTKANGVTEENGKVTVHTDSGDFEGDVCVAADGIGSKVPWPIPGGFTDVKDSGYAVARVAFPKSTIKTGSPAEKITKSIDEQGPQFRTYVGGDNVSLILFLTTDHVAWAFSHEVSFISPTALVNILLIGICTRPTPCLPNHGTTCEIRKTSSRSSRSPVIIGIRQSWTSSVRRPLKSSIGV